MQRTLSLLAVLASALVAGCATAPAPAPVEMDPMDGLIAKDAAEATQALRELAESAGQARVVTQVKPTHTTPIGMQPRAVAPAADAPQVAYAAQPKTSIAARRSTMAVEIDSPPPAVIASPSSGVVASGGLLSVPPAGLERLVTVHWTGELEQLLSRVAQEAGWRMGASTGLRVSPVIISINAENRSAFDVLRDAGAIAGSSADIRVSSLTKTISVNYPQR